MNPNIEQFARTMVHELNAKKCVVLAIFAVVSIIAMVIGNSLPKQYTSFSTIVVERRDIIGPLMDGAAETTDVRDLSAIVEELAFSRRSMERILSEGGWLDDDPSLVEQELLTQDIQDATDIDKSGSNLIFINYSDTDPERAYLVTRLYTDWVIQESAKAKQRESERAFEFIDKQTQEYHQKLVQAEEALKQFRTENMEALPESASEVNSRATKLSRDIEQVRLELAEAEVRATSLEAQLNGEAEITGNLTREAIIRERITELQKELDTLRLSYYDTYPDIVVLRGQIDGLMEKLTSDSSSESLVFSMPEGSEEEASDSAAVFSPLYQSLRSELSRNQTLQQTLKTRLREMETILQTEIQRGRRIADSEAEQTELIRDYEVNDDIYQDLLKRRERARLSMNLSKEEQGFAMKLQEPPALPLAPEGIRFIHVVAAGFVVGIGLPIGLLFLLVRFDPRIRWERRISEELALPVLAAIPLMDTAAVKRRRAASTATFWIGIAAVTGIYGTVGWLKYNGMI